MRPKAPAWDWRSRGLMRRAAAGKSNWPMVSPTGMAAWAYLRGFVCRARHPQHLLSMLQRSNLNESVTKARDFYTAPHLGPSVRATRTSP